MRREYAVAATNAIPDGALRVEISGAAVPERLRSIACLPGLGIHPDAPAPLRALVDVGLATNVPALPLAGSGVLIERGGPAYAVKLSNAAAAGASFAVVMNYASGPTNDCPPGDQLCPLGGTDFSPIPAVFVSNSDGVALRDLLRGGAVILGRIALNPVVTRFVVADTLRCESVQLRLRTDHPVRGDLRVTLTSPGGTRSVLQAYNADTAPGPVDWTYSSTHHLLEPTAGIWTLAVTDEGAGASGNQLAAALILHGVPIADADGDGLDDDWERRRLGGLAGGPGDDPDADGWSNAIEALAGADPARPDRSPNSQMSEWKPGFARVTVPVMPGMPRDVLTGERPDVLGQRLSVVAPGIEAAAILPATNAGARFVRALPSAR